ncbi:class F sortase [Streptomyces sp. ISL-100]|uniref:class F sortase n=1 Tax=Streptomyces sp. ISL-100 TaxID=2819173 RepID=UPI001BEC321A|nr:class F sortase [Streptomyces sp. ISL-100]MBT2401882.1 class F sortase [Streptomyces sp. ISL-100]
MSRTQQAIRRTVTLPATACLIVAALTSCSSDPAEGGAAGEVGSPSRASAAADNPDATTADDKTTTSAPAQVTIPSIGVSSSLMRLGLNADGTVEVPPEEKGMTAGWYTGGPVPGEPGPAVIIGHNSTRLGKAVFHDLEDIAKGADIAVRNKQGKTAHFTVTGTETVSKNAFPTAKVYGESKGRVLRLITCDGAFDAQGHPVDNLIVYATLR